MRIPELFRVSSSALTRHKLRAFLTPLGVIIGVATVVGVVSVISGLNTYVKDKVIGLNPDIVIFTKYGIIMSREEWLIAMKRRDITLTDMQIVRNTGKSVPDIRKKNNENLFPKFTTWREQIDGKYWFPTYSLSDDVLHFRESDQHIREVVKYTNYQRFGANVKITYEGKEIQKQEQKDSQSKDTTEQPPPDKK